MGLAPAMRPPDRSRATIGPCDIRILGSLDVLADDGRPIAVGGARLRALMIRLALSAGEMVPTSRLVDDPWEDRRPVDAADALRLLVSRLRIALGADC